MLALVYSGPREPTSACFSSAFLEYFLIGDAFFFASAVVYCYPEVRIHLLSTVGFFFDVFHRRDKYILRCNNPPKVQSSRYEGVLADQGFLFPNPTSCVRILGS